MTFELIPAIDILDGQVVRLHKGDYDASTVYGDDPVAMARSLESAGATRLHVVDLNGAKEGRPVHGALIEAMCKSTNLRLQVGGGIRDAAAARAWWALGVERVVMGTAAIKAPAVVQALCAERDVVIALDARSGEVAVEGWLEGSGKSIYDVAAQVDAWGAAAILYTNIEHDGTGEGPDVTGTAKLQSQLKTPVIASGGVGRLDDIRALAAAGIQASVVGKALYSGVFTLEEAFRVATSC
ncbi:MAG: phosphoribosylformimino-5-aminoimidazole carboxamide ribotide isomerase [Polyangiales bacterium]|jgi:phosphoribosylformimino-5-aminoimidazole carboxamide ribotide isomerase